MKNTLLLFLLLSSSLCMAQSVEVNGNSAIVYYDSMQYENPVLRIFNIIGRVVGYYDIDKHSIISLNEYNDGIYLFVVCGSRGNCKTIRVNHGSKRKLGEPSKTKSL